VRGEGFLTSIQEVDKEFYNQFLKHCKYMPLEDSEKQHPFLQLTDTSNYSFNVLVRHFKRGGKFREEEEAVVYPVITIQNDTPTIYKPYVRSLTEEQGNWREKDGTKVGDIVELPVPMEHKYQISVASYYQKEIFEIQAWFHRTFSIDRQDASFLFKELNVGYNKLGVPVKYYASIIHTNTDSKFEFICDFSVKTWVHFRQNVTMESIEELRLILNEMTPDGIKLEVLNKII